MLIDCDTCTGQGVHCDTCVIAVFLDTPRHTQPTQYHLDSDEQIALVHLAEAGLVPPLRLIQDSNTSDPTGHESRGIA
jgi:hypothetical protein